jgi:hypothetical protein
MGTLLVLSTSKIISIIFLIAMVCVIIYALIMSPKWKKRDEKREKNAPDFCKKGDYLIGKIVAESWYSDMRGWVIRKYGADVKGEVEDYKKDVGCVKVNDEWYVITGDAGGLSVDKIIPK